MATRKEKTHGLKQARKALKLKLKMEAPFKRELKSYFFKQYKKAKSGIPFDSISPVLDKQYSRVVREMTGIRVKADDDYGLENELTMMLLGLADSRAKLIDQTTTRKMKRALDIAREDLRDQGILFPSDTLLNNTAAQIFRQLNRSRVGGIAVSETQMTTEGTQAIKNEVADDMIRDAIVSNDAALAKEAAELSESMTMDQISKNIGKVESSELFAALALMRKMWVTMGDSVVRAWHASANFQIVDVGDPFIVNGERLMHPGDGSMGASIENLANCRCHSSYL